MSGAKEKATGGIIVTAIHNGLYDQLRKPGDVFEIREEKHFSARWMRKGRVATDAPVADMAKKARAEALAAGGPSAALTTALADLKDAAEREAAALAKVAELEAVIAEKDAKIAELQGEVQETAPDAAPGDAAPAADESGKKAEEGGAPAPSAPVQRVRRTPAA
jgi:hypothetical protein